MRAAFGLIALLLGLLIVLKLGKTQLDSLRPAPAASSVPTALPAQAASASPTAPRQQVEAVGRQVQDVMNDAARRASEAQP